MDGLNSGAAGFFQDYFFGSANLTVAVRCRLGSLINDETALTVAVITDWPGPVVLGYRGFLERLRFAIDPGIEADTGMILFGEVDSPSNHPRLGKPT